MNMLSQRTSGFFKGLLLSFIIYSIIQFLLYGIFSLLTLPPSIGAMLISEAFARYPALKLVLPIIGILLFLLSNALFLYFKKASTIREGVRFGFIFALLFILMVGKQENYVREAVNEFNNMQLPLEAQQNNDVSLCDAMRASRFDELKQNAKNRCYTKIAVQLGDATVCDRITDTDSYTARECIARVGEKQNKFSACAGYQYWSQVETCLQLISKRVAQGGKFPEFPPPRKQLEDTICSAVPTILENGREEHPRAKEYEHLKILGPMFTAYSCGGEHFEKRFGSLLSNYTQGLRIITGITPNILKEVITNMGFECADIKPSGLCFEWVLDEPIINGKLMLLILYSDLIKGDDCVHCG